jgi:tripartite-type tricarboxylate transporter receptor subunit TctC
MVVNYSGLPSTATASHLHGPASLTGTAGVQINLVPYNGGGYGTAGALTGKVPLDFNTLQSVVDNATYLNFHTTNNPNGEIRGHLMR